MRRTLLCLRPTSPFTMTPAFKEPADQSQEHACPETLRATRAMRMSWFTRSKNFSRSRSTTQSCPSSIHTHAPVAPRRDPVCQGETHSSQRRNAGRNCAASVFDNCLLIKRSNTVGIPNSRTPPPGFGYLYPSDRLRSVVALQNRRHCLRGNPLCR